MAMFVLPTFARTVLASLAIGALATSGCSEDACGQAATCLGLPTAASTESQASDTLASSAATTTTSVTVSATAHPTNTGVPPNTLPPHTDLPDPSHDSSTSTATVDTDNGNLTGADDPTEDTELGTQMGDSSEAPDTEGFDTADLTNFEGFDTTDAESAAVSTAEDPGANSSQEPDVTNASHEVPATSHCAPVADWDPAWSQWEEEVLQLVNEFRATGADCDTEGSFGPTTPLAMEPTLRCSARLHSEDMFVRDYFAHDNPDGLDPFERMEEAGFEGGWLGENIAAGQQTPDEVMQAWIDSDGHCSNIMNPNFTLLGVGYYPGGDNWQEGQHFWTQNFGTPLN
jgi:uncharacterized protein YkwD